MNAVPGNLDPRTKRIKEFFDGDSVQYLDQRYPEEPTNNDQFSYLVRRRYVLEVRYAAPREPCRALSRYDLWISTPKLEDGYAVELDVAPDTASEDRADLDETTPLSSRHPYRER